MKQIIPTFESYLQNINEGGWATVKTQNTVLTPAIIKEVVEKMQIIGAGFNTYLKRLDLPSLDFTKPVGSGTWWQEDLVNQPDKVYGDVDFIVAYPTLELTGPNIDRHADEIATVKLYNAELIKWLSDKKLDFVDIDETIESSKEGSVKIILKLKNNDNVDYVQVDLVVTHKEYMEWAIFRFTPIKNVKGFVLGNLYSTLGRVFELSIMHRGVRAKFVDGIMVPYLKRKNTVDTLISKDTTNFIKDIAKFFWEQSNASIPFAPSETLRTWKGMDPNNPKFEDLCQGIRALADTLSQLDEFGTVLKYRSRDEFLTTVVEMYIEKMKAAAESGKFNKAQTPAAEAAAQKVRNLVSEYTEKAKLYLLQ